MRKLLHSVLLLISYLEITGQVTNIYGPAGSGKFGVTIAVLPNGNYVVTDPLYDDETLIDAGAVYLFNGKTHSLISFLKGSSVNDSIGNYGITILNSGNFLIRSSNWDNGSVHNAGAITWCSGTEGLSGIVNSSNSLVGSSADEQLGIQPVVELTNGNYVVRDQNWSNGAATFAGAAIWCNATSPRSGFIDATNALVGSHTFDMVGHDVIPLDNGNYIVSTPSWSNSGTFAAGAVTWCNGAMGRVGEVSEANSLVGTHAGDRVGEGGIIKLANGNFVIKSPSWNVFAVNPDAMGAVTWGSGTNGVAGPVSSSNSLTKTGPTYIGGPFITPLPNGNYVVTSPGWGKSGLICAGAITWADGSTGISGEVNTWNSLIGSGVTYPAQIFIVPLKNGNYVISYPNWKNGTGAVTWANGTSPTTGIITSYNSLIGNQPGDYVGNVIALFNGNYVISSPNWSDGTVTARSGAITWCNGTRGQTGFVTASNSLIGTHAFDQVGSGGIVPLQNNKYVICSPLWNNGSEEGAGVGAVTLVDGNIAITGSISPANSLIGSHRNDYIGKGGIVRLANGNFAVASPDWDSGPATDVGAVTWVDADSDGGGIVSINNSIIGTHTNDRVGVVIPLNNGNYVVMTPAWNSSAGSVTWASGKGGTTGEVSSSNSIVGGKPGDNAGFDNTIVELSNGNYLIRSPNWSNGSLSNAGAVTWCNGSSCTAGIIDSINSLVGTHTDDAYGYGVGYSISTFANGNYAVRNMNWDNDATPDAGAVTWGNGSASLSGIVTECNSVKGGVRVSSEQDFMPFSFNKTYNFLLVGRPAENMVSIYRPEAMALPLTKDSSYAIIHGNAPVPLTSEAGCRILATLEPNGVHPIDGPVKAKIWVENDPITTGNILHVGRHYEIAPETDAATATANITLYFTQNDFDSFNVHASNMLPIKQIDNAGKARLRIFKYTGVSSDGSGLPASYSGNVIVIDPIDDKIVWNSHEQRWEVSFEVNGFSGLFVGISSSALPLNLLSFNAKMVDDKTALDWETTGETATSRFEVERSKDGLHYLKIGTVPASNTFGTHQYNYIDPTPGSIDVPVVFYRLKLLDIDGSFTYSKVATVTVGKNKNVVFVFPNPAADKLNIFVNTTCPEHMKGQIIDNVGKVLKQFEWKINAGSSTYTINLSMLACSTYYLDLQGKKTHSRFLFFKN